MQCTMRSILAATGAAVVLSGCPESDTLGPSGMADAGTDAGDLGVGAPDAPGPDGGSTDLGDAGILDAGGLDSGISDSGVSDSGVSDSGVSDSGVSDSGVPDSGVPDAGPSCAEPSRFISEIVAHGFGTGQNHNQTRGFPEVLYGPPEAGNSESVVSLGNGGWLIAAFGDNAIVDGPGPDFIVFENPIGNFYELATVSVSEDGVAWEVFPCTGSSEAPVGCAGVGLVHSSRDNGIDPLDPAVAGGDAFDLAEVGLTTAYFVRIEDRPDLVGTQGVFDLDAIAIVNALCR